MDTLESLNQTSNCTDRIVEVVTNAFASAGGYAKRKMTPLLELDSEQGLNAHKRVNRRERHVLCDNGRIWLVHAANGSSYDGISALLLLSL